MKFRSSMTLFARAAPDEDAFQRCIDKYFAGGPDPATLAGSRGRAFGRSERHTTFCCENRMSVLLISQSPG